jgi:signal transduction histidine kinase
MPARKKLALLIVVYWVMLLYIMAALIWWFIALNRQNEEMMALRLSKLTPGTAEYTEQLKQAQNFRARKIAQYTGEGVIFMLLILIGALFVYRAARKQLQLGQQQQNFMMAVTHELKTPIAAARLNIETLQKRQLDPDKQQILLQRTLVETERLNDLTNNILLASRLETQGSAGQQVRFDLAILVADVVKQYQQRYPASPIKLQLPKHEMPVRADDMLLRLLISNLLDNAYKYGSNQRAPEVVLEEINGNKVCLLVKDSGPGIPIPERQKVFEKFYRMGNELTRNARGTGLGLYLCKRIAEAAGGTITIKDNKPQGTVIEVILPLTT